MQLCAERVNVRVRVHYITSARWCCYTCTFLIVIMCQLFERKPVLYMEEDTHIVNHITSSANINIQSHEYNVMHVAASGRNYLSIISPFCHL